MERSKVVGAPSFSMGTAVEPKSMMETATIKWVEENDMKKSGSFASVWQETSNNKKTIKSYHSEIWARSPWKWVTNLEERLSKHQHFDPQGVQCVPLADSKAIEFSDYTKVEKTRILEKNPLLSIMNTYSAGVHMVGAPNFWPPTRIWKKIATKSKTQDGCFCWFWKSAKKLHKNLNFIVESENRAVFAVGLFFICEKVPWYARNTGLRSSSRMGVHLDFEGARSDQKPFQIDSDSDCVIKEAYPIKKQTHPTIYYIRLTVLYLAFHSTHLPRKVPGVASVHLGHLGWSPCVFSLRPKMWFMKITWFILIYFDSVSYNLSQLD